MLIRSLGKGLVLLLLAFRAPVPYLPVYVESTVNTRDHIGAVENIVVRL